MAQNQNFTQGKVLGPLIRFALPVLAALFLQTMYGAVDLLIVGQFADAAQVSAVATGSRIMQTVTAVICGLAVGTTVLLGNRIGAGKAKEGGRLLGADLMLFGAISLVLTAVMVLFPGVFAGLMQAPAEAFDSTCAYLRICAAGTVFIVGFNLLGSVFRGIGNANLPLISVAIACVVNILGDLLLVGALGWGAAGAAVATVAAQGISVILSLLIIRRLRLPFSFSRRDLRWDKAAIKETLQVGTPIAFQELLVSISFMAIVAITNGLGVVASAGVGVAEKICGFVMLVPSAYMQSMSAFVAQNMGAGRPDRAKKALVCSIGTSLLVGLFFGYLAFFQGELLSGFFAKDPAVIAASARYLMAYGIDCLLVSFLFCSLGYFSGCQKTTFVMVQGLVGAFLIRIPVAMLMSRAEPVDLFHVGLATPASTVVQILMCAVYFFFCERRLKKAKQTSCSR